MNVRATEHAVLLFCAIVFQDDNELVLETGQVLNVYGDVDEDGFYTAAHTVGPSAGKRGYIPSNFVEDYVEGESEALIAEAGVVATPASEAPALSPDDGGNYARVLYDYDPAANGENEDADDELVIFSNQMLKVLTEIDDDGFFMAEHMEGDDVGKTGMVPSNFVEMLSATSKAGIYVVLYDYDPEEASPNDDPTDELPLKEGEFVQVSTEEVQCYHGIYMYIYTISMRACVLDCPMLCITKLVKVHAF